MFRKLINWIAGSGSSHPAPAYVGGIFARMTPEGLCGIDPARMNRDEIKSRLATLYKRHNSAAGSLDPGLRKEAEHMLDAIVQCREKYIDNGI